MNISQVPPKSVNEHFEALRHTSDTLRDGVVTILESMDEREVNAAAIEREEFRQKCQKLANAISDRIGELESLKRKLRDIRADQKNDVSKLTNRYFDLIRERKTNNAN